jgi:heme exporter protein A
MEPEFKLLRVENLSCERGGRLLFSKLNFELCRAQYYELRGPNGAGKSSLLRLLAGLGDAAEGEFMMGEGFHYVGHQDGIKPALTVREHLHFWAKVQNGGDVEAALKVFSLEDLAHEQAAYLSQGQKRRLGLSRLALAQRGVWLLDEPTVGLDATSLHQLQALIKNHLTRGNAVLAATHVELGVTPNQTITLGTA